MVLTKVPQPVGMVSAAGNVSEPMPPAMGSVYVKPLVTVFSRVAPVTLAGLPPSAFKVALSICSNTMADQ